MESVGRTAPKSEEKLPKGAFTIDCDIRLQAKSLVVTIPKIIAFISAAVGGAIGMAEYLRQ